MTEAQAAPIIKVLIAEDSQDDALLIERQLRKGGYNPMMHRVDNATAMKQALDSESWDLIITDHNMPSFDSKDALTLSRQYDSNIPFIVVSGSIGEEIAVDAMKSGAHDYVMKNNLARLLPAIERELREAENRRAHEKAEATIRYMAYHDSLTGLINRAEFERRLEDMVQSALHEGHAHALLYIDLDQFKLVNDTCGHLAGDALLKRLTRRLQSNIRDSDTLARLGGDEFGVLLKNCPMDKAENVAHLILENIQSYTFMWSDKNFKVGASIGMVQVTGETPPTEILSQSDMACYAAKDLGRNRIHVYHETDKLLSQRRGEMQWVQRITDAMRLDTLVLFRQHILALQGGTSHHEILLRMREEDGTLIAPGRFIPAAERYSLMSEVDRWVIIKTCEQLKSLDQKHPLQNQESTVFINLSGTSLSDKEMAGYIEKQLERFDIAPKRIGFEITETAAIVDYDAALKLIAELRKLGCLVALDDFGTGMSSFSYIKSLDVDYIKIDGSFVKNMLEQEMDCAIVESINKIGHIVGMKTIAEFVENEQILKHVKDLGIDFAQGWGIAHPIPLSDI